MLKIRFLDKIEGLKKNPIFLLYFGQISKEIYFLEVAIFEDHLLNQAIFQCA